MGGRRGGCGKAVLTSEVAGGGEVGEGGRNLTQL